MEGGALSIQYQTPVRKRLQRFNKKKWNQTRVVAEEGKVAEWICHIFQQGLEGPANDLNMDVLERKE